MKRILYILSILIICSCKQNSTENIISENCKIFDISFEKDYSDKLYLSEVIDSEQYVQFETKDECLISGINKLVLQDNKYYVLDNIEDIIYIFSKDGSFLNKISKKGRGPGEYISIDCFDVNPKTKEINILSLNTKKIFVYNDNCQLKNTIELDDIVRDFIICENGDYLFFTPDKNEGHKSGLWRCDKNGLFKEQLISLEEDFEYGGISPYYFQRIDIDLIGFMGLEDKGLIYHITNDTIIPKYKIKVDIKIPEEIKSASVIDKNEYRGATYKLIGYRETSKYMSLNISNLGDKNIFLFYDKKNNSCTKICDFENLINDTDYLQLGFLLTESDNKRIAQISAFGVMEIPELKNKFLNIDENSNPVLAITKYR